MIDIENADINETKARQHPKVGGFFICLGIPYKQGHTKT